MALPELLEPQVPLERLEPQVLPGQPELLV